MVADAGGLLEIAAQLLLFDHSVGQARVLDHERELSRATPQSAFLRRAVFGAGHWRAEQQDPGDFVLRQ